MIKIDQPYIKKRNYEVTIVKEICFSQILILSFNTNYNFW